MHCYNHQTKEAIGLCRHCFKGLCQECCQKNEDFLVCSENCAQKVSEIEEMNERAKNIYGIGKYASKRHFPLSVVLYLCMGVLFISLGVSDLILYHVSLSNYDIFFISFGVLCLLFSLLAWRRTSKIGIIL
jgi:hypothetical protein